MAAVDIENVVGYVDKRRTKDDVGGTAGKTWAATSAYADVPASLTTLRARLTTINSSYYTAARMDTMTRNDLVYAARLSDDAAGV